MFNHFSELGDYLVPAPITEAAMQKWEYQEIVQLIDIKTGKQRWRDHANWTIDPLPRLRKEANEAWELISAYSFVRRGTTEVHFILKRGVLL